MAVDLVNHASIEVASGFRGAVVIDIEAAQQVVGRCTVGAGEIVQRHNTTAGVKAEGQAIVETAIAAFPLGRAVDASGAVERKIGTGILAIAGVTETVKDGKTSAGRVLEDNSLVQAPSLSCRPVQVVRCI